MGEIEKRKATIGCENCRRVIFDLEVLRLTGEPTVIVVKNCREDGKAKMLSEWVRGKALSGWPELLNVLVIDMKGEQDLRGLKESDLEAYGWIKKGKVYRNRRLNRPKKAAPVPPPEASNLEGV